MGRKLRPEVGDIVAVAWKDIKVTLAADTRLGGVGYRLFWGLLFAFGMPLLMRDIWFTSPEVLVIWAWLPIYVTSPMIGSAIAGEREHHTLETLLASRLSDRAIVLGKIAAVAVAGWAYALSSILGGALSVGLATRGAGPGSYRPDVWVGGLVGSLLGAWLGAAAGVAVSLRAATQRQAQDSISVVTMGITIGVVVVRSVLAALGVPVVDSLLGVNGWALAGGFVVVLALADAVISRLALARFKRVALLLD